MKAGKIIIGLLSGAAAGAAIGMLFAPKKGADTRREIGQTGDSYLKGAKTKFNEFADNINHKVEAVKNKSKAQFSDSKSEEVINKAKAEMHEMKRN